MKKLPLYGIIGVILVVLITVVLIVSIPQSTLPGTTCYGESDAGYDIYNKGTVTFTTGGGSATQYTDRCVDANTLREYNCVDHPTYVSYNDIECVCIDGACESDKCSGVSCNNKCEGNNRLYDGECNPSTGKCEYRQEICQFGCENAHCLDPECSSDSDCGSGEECKDNVCVEKPECLTDADCKDNQKCLDNKCVFNPECTSDNDCELDEICQNNVCVQNVECKDDSDCANTEVCRAGRCESAGCTEGLVTEYYECGDGTRVPECLCINGVEQCNQNPEELCGKDWTLYIIIGIIVLFIFGIIAYSLIKSR